jgi:uncharacterized phiE125 gp8 family phage protein
MPIHLYRTRRWWRNGFGHTALAAGAHTDLPPRIGNALVSLGLATFHSSSCGDIMSEDLTSSLTLIAAPTAEPLTLSEAKSFLRIEHGADDALVTRAIAASRQAAEHYLRSALLPQTWEYRIGRTYRCEVRLPFGPARSITSITATDDGGESQILDVSGYKLSVDGSRVMFASAPACAVLAIRYTASMADDADTLPALIKQGMLHHIAAMLEQREGSVPLPMQSIACYLPYRKIGL